MSHIYWDQSKYAWILKWRSSKDSSDSRQIFSVQRYKADGLTEKEADQAALDAAKTVRLDLVERKIIIPGGFQQGPRSPGVGLESEKKSTVPGVTWCKSKSAWRVRLRRTIPGSNGKERYMDGGYFRPVSSNPADIVEARSRAEARQAELCLEHGIQHTSIERKDATQFVKHHSSVNGVSWNAAECVWRAQIRINKKQVGKRFRPLDDSEANIVRSRVEAEAWVQDMQQKSRKEEEKTTAADAAK